MATLAEVRRRTGAPSPNGITGTAIDPGVGGTIGQGINESGVGQTTPTNPLAGYTGASLQVPQASVNVNPQNIASSPAYQFRMGQGTEAIDRSGSARGSLLTGGTLKDLTAFGQGLASTEYDNEWQRQYGLANLNANISGGNANRELSGLTSLTGYGMDAANGVSNAYSSYGDAAAAGAVGRGKVISQGVNAGVNTIGEYLAGRNSGGSGTEQQASNGGKGVWGTIGSYLASLFNHKGKDAPVGGTGGGGGGNTPTGTRDNTGRGVTDPQQGTLPTMDQRAMDQLQREWRQSNSGLSFEEWFKQKYGGGSTDFPSFTLR